MDQIRLNFKFYKNFKEHHLVGNSATTLDSIEISLLSQLKQTEGTVTGLKLRQFISKKYAKYN